MDRLDAMQLFVRVVETGSFSAVARERDVGQPAVSKQIAALEAHLGAQLLRRTTRELTLTEAGQDFYESALRLVSDFDAAESRIGRGQASPMGLLRVNVAPVFGRLLVVPKLARFFERYPDISVDLHISDRTAHMIEDGIDVAIHNGDLPDSSLIARRIATTPVITVGTPTYLKKRGMPKTPSDLEAHACIIYLMHGAPRAWKFAGKFGAVFHQPRGPFRTSDAEQIRAAVLSDIGLAHTPEWLFAREIASGAVERILRRYEPDELTISAVHPAGRRLSAKARVFIDFFEAELASS